MISMVGSCSHYLCFELTPWSGIVIASLVSIVTQVETAFIYGSWSQWQTWGVKIQQRLV